MPDNMLYFRFPTGHAATSHLLVGLLHLAQDLPGRGHFRPQMLGPVMEDQGRRSNNKS